MLVEHLLEFVEQIKKYSNIDDFVNNQSDDMIKITTEEKKKLLGIQENQRPYLKQKLKEILHNLSEMEKQKD